MSTLETPFTELEGVNAILWAIGKNPVTSLDSAATNSDAEAALAELRNTSLDIQKVGRSFNREISWLLTPAEDGTISLPDGTLKVTLTDYDRKSGYVVRGKKLYDPNGHTFVFEKAVTADLILLLPFDDLPASARWLVTVRAARRFSAKRLGTASAAKLSEHDETLAVIDFEHSEDEADQRTLLESSPHIQRMRIRR